MRLFVKKALVFTMVFIALFALLEFAARGVYSSHTDLFFKHDSFASEKSGIEVLFLGSSHVEGCVNPQHLSKTSFNLAFASQDMHYNNAIFQRYIDDMPHLRFVVVELSPFSLGYDEERAAAHITKDYFWQLGILPRSGNILRPLVYSSVLLAHQDTVVPDFFAGKRPRPLGILRKRYIPQPPPQHNMLLQNGYRYHYTAMVPETLARHGESRAQFHYRHYSEDNIPDNLHLLRQILDTASRRNLQVVLVTPPMTKYYYQALPEHVSKAFVSHISGIQREFPQITCYDFGEGMGFEDSDFYNSDHLNYHGAQKFTQTFDLLLKLHHGDPQVLRRTVRQLGDLGPLASAGVRQMSTMLATEDTTLRQYIIEAFGKIGLAAKIAEPKLLAALGDDNIQVRIAAARSIALIGANAEAAVPVLLSLYKRESVSEKSTALIALGSMGKRATLAHPQIIEALGDESPAVRAAAAFAAGNSELGGEDTLDTLATMLTKEPDERVRVAAAYALGKLRSTEQRIIASLLSATCDSNEEVRYNAALALSQVGVVAIPMIQKALAETKDVQQQRYFVAAIGALGPQAAVLGKTLVPYLAHQDSAVRKAAVEAFEQIGENTLPSLLQKLQNSDDKTRSEVAKVAKSILQKALKRSLLEEQLPQFIPLLRHQDERICRSALEIVSAIAADSSQAVSILANCLDDKRPAIRKAVALELYKASERAAHIAPSLVAALADADQQTQIILAKTLAKTGSKSIDAIIPALADKNAQTRYFAAYAISHMAVVPPKVTADLTSALRDGEWFVRFQAAYALGKIQLDDTAVVIPALEQLLRDPQAQVRACAAKSLGKLGRKSASALTSLHQALDDSDTDVKTAVAEAVGNIGAHTPQLATALIGKLAEPQAQVRAAVAYALGNSPVQRDAIAAALAKALDDPNATVRHYAVKSLGKMGDTGIELLCQALAQPQLKADKIDIVVAFGDAPAQAKQTIPLLMALLRDPDEKTRAYAALALVRLGEQSLDTVRAALRDKDFGIRERAVEILGKIGAPAAAAIPDLIALFSDQRAFLRAAAIQALVNIGEKSIPALREALSKKNIRFYAIQTLARMEERARDTATEIAQLAADPSTDVATRREAARALTLIAPKSTETMAILIALLREQDTSLPQCAVECFVKIGPPAIIPLAECLHRGGRQIKFYAALGLGNLGAEAVPELVQALVDEDAQTSFYAATALMRMGEKTVATLVKTLDHPRPHVRQNAIYALAGIGKQAAAVIPALQKALQDSDKNVREAAREALERMEK